MWFYILSLSWAMAFSHQIAAPEPLPLTIEKAVQIALEKNPSIQMLNQEIESARAQTLMATAWPEAEAGFSTEGLGLSKVARKNETEYSLGLAQPFPFPGKLKLQNEIGKYYELESRLRLEKEKIILSSEVKEAYYQCLLNQNKEETLQRNQEWLKEIERNALSLYALGKVPYTDVIRLRLEIARTKNDWLEVKRELLSSFYRLNLLLGLENGTKLKLLSPLQHLPRPELTEIQLEKAREISPTLQLAAMKKRRSGLQIRLAEKDRWPDFSLGLFSPSHRVGAIGFSFNLSYPLFSRRKLKGEKLLAQAEWGKALVSVQATERFYQVRKKEALDQVLQAEQQVKIFEENLLTEMDAALKKALSDYQLGKIDSLNLLDLYRSSAQVELEYYRALYLYLSALAELERAGEDYE
ncbi:MAG: TolC family protein [Candidatus Saccharicenans sp.]